MSVDYEKAVQLVATTRKTGIAFLRQKLLLSESKVSRLLARMEKEGVISTVQSGGIRTVLIEPPAQDVTTRDDSAEV